MLVVGIQRCRCRTRARLSMGEDSRRGVAGSGSPAVGEGGDGQAGADVVLSRDALRAAALSVPTRTPVFVGSHDAACVLAAFPTAVNGEQMPSYQSSLNQSSTSEGSVHR